METQAAKSLLIIEDNSDIAECLLRCFELENFDTKLARSGEEGLLLSKHNPPRVILLDVLLPDMNGMEICRRMRSEPATRSSRIIMLSARASRADIALGLAAGADAYICKPFSVRDLVERVYDLLGPEGGRRH